MLRRILKRIFGSKKNPQVKNDEIHSQGSQIDEDDIPTWIHYLGNDETTQELYINEFVPYSEADRSVLGVDKFYKDDKLDPKVDTFARLCLNKAVCIMQEEKVDLFKEFTCQLEYIPKGMPKLAAFYTLLEYSSRDEFKSIVLLGLDDCGLATFARVK